MKDTLQDVNRAAPTMLRLLAVSREPSTFGMLWAAAEANAWHLETAASGFEALERVQASNAPDLVLLDLARGDSDGIHALRWLHRVSPGLPVVLLGYSDDPQEKSLALRLGAHDYVSKPVGQYQIEAVIQRCLNGGHPQPKPGHDMISVRDDRTFVAASTATRKLRAQAELLAQVEVPVLVAGEPGSGKETAARLIHKLSARSPLPFRKLDCASLSAESFDRELAGQAGPLYTSGRPAVDGASGGTIFLDDIADLPVQLQNKLVRRLQESQLGWSNGGPRTASGARVIAATSHRLDEVLRERKLREDLFYRLSAFTMYVPPLRERREEIPLLAECFMGQLAQQYGAEPRAFTAEILDACQAYSWPGNLRELEAFVKRYLVIGDGDFVLRELTRPGNGTRHDVAPDAAEAEEAPGGLRWLLRTVKGEAERNAITRALEQTRWNRRAAARLLKVSYRTLLYKIQQYHMSPPPAAASGAAPKGEGPCP